MKAILILLFLQVMLASCAVAGGVSSSSSSSSSSFAAVDIMADFYPDKAAYRPGDAAVLKLELDSTAATSQVSGTLMLTVSAPDSNVYSAADSNFSFAAGQTGSRSWNWTLPAADGRGYLAEVVLSDGAGNVYCRKATALDASSNAFRYIRYGYIAWFGPDLSGSEGAIVRNLAKYHINALQFYDWQWKHHWPYTNAAAWKDIANRDVSSNTLAGLIAAAHSNNIIAMNYNLAYGAAPGYGSDGSGVNVQWGLFNDASHSSQYAVTGLPPAWAYQDIWLFNPADPGWQAYICGREAEVFSHYAFDGWHVDQLGDPGTKYDYSGNPVTVGNTFEAFLDCADTNLNRPLIFNAVNSYGLSGTGRTSNASMYVEVWDNDGFDILKTGADNARQAAYGAKPVVLAAYMDYNYANGFSSGSPGQFNMPGILLADAVIFASGAAHLELGDGNRMLCSEYFPNRNLVMSGGLQKRLRSYYDFLTAYENMLRDGAADYYPRVEVTGKTVSSSAAANSVWALAKTDAVHNVLHLINLLNNDNSGWRDASASCAAPVPLSNIAVKWYQYSGAVSALWYASPDYDGGRTVSLSFSAGSDGNGNYVQAVVPLLEYWSMLYYRNSVTLSPVGVSNAGFEEGNIDGWTEWHPAAQSAKYGVDGSDVHGGSYKLYFWDTSAYQQSVHQVVSNLPAGTYVLKAWIKATQYGGGDPAFCRMECLQTGNPDQYANAVVDGTWKQYGITATVASGLLDIGFYVNSSGNTSMQIDDVSLNRLM